MCWNRNCNQCWARAWVVIFRVRDSSPSRSHSYFNDCNIFKNNISDCIQICWIEYWWRWLCLSHRHNDDDDVDDNIVSLHYDSIVFRWALACSCIVHSVKMATTTKKLLIKIIDYEFECRVNLSHDDTMTIEITMNANGVILHETCWRKQTIWVHHHHHRRSCNDRQNANTKRRRRRGKNTANTKTSHVRNGCWLSRFFCTLYCWCLAKSQVNKQLSTIVIGISNKNTHITSSSSLFIFFFEWIYRYW